MFEPSEYPENLASAADDHTHWSGWDQIIPQLDVIDKSCPVCPSSPTPRLLSPFGFFVGQCLLTLVGTYRGSVGIDCCSAVARCTEGGRRCFDQTLPQRFFPCLLATGTQSHRPDTQLRRTGRKLFTCARMLSVVKMSISANVVIPALRTAESSKNPSGLRWLIIACAPPSPSSPDSHVAILTGFFFRV